MFSQQPTPRDFGACCSHLKLEVCCPGDHGDYDLWSYGADNAPGGEGENADVTSWEVLK